MFLLPEEVLPLLLGLGMVVGDQEGLVVQVFACQQIQESGLQSPVSVDPGWTPVFLGL